MLSDGTFSRSVMSRGSWSLQDKSSSSCSCSCMLAILRKLALQWARKMFAESHWWLDWYEMSGMALN